MATGAVTLRGRFVDGTEVKVYPRIADFFDGQALGSLVVKGKPKDGELYLSGLEAGATYWAVQEVDGQQRHAAITAHNAFGSDIPVHPPEGAAHAPELQRQRISSGYNENTIEGARSTSAVPKAHGPSENPEQAPYHDVADVKGAKQSDTAMGSGHEVAPEEEIPPLPQESAATREEIAAAEKPKRSSQTKAQRSAAAKKAARTRKRKAAKRAPAKKARKSSTKSKRSK